MTNPLSLLPSSMRVQAIFIFAGSCFSDALLWFKCVIKQLNIIFIYSIMSRDQFMKNNNLPSQNIDQSMCPVIQQKHDASDVAV